MTGFFVGRVHLWILRSQLMDNLEGHIYTDYLEHYFDLKPFPEEEGLTNLMLRKMLPEADPDSLNLFFAKSLYHAFGKRAASLISDHNYSEAFLLMKFAENMRSHEPLLHKINPDLAIQRQAAEGILNSFTGIAEGCINNGKYLMADNYLARADEYARQNAGIIGSDSVYRTVYSRLFFIRNTECDRLLDQGNFSGALDCYREMENRYAPSELAAISVSVNERMNRARAGLLSETMKQTDLALNSHENEMALKLDDKAMEIRREMKITGKADKQLAGSPSPDLLRLRYDRIYGEAAAALEKRQFTLSLQQFDSARAFSQAFLVTVQAEFDSLYRRAMKHYLLIQLSSSQRRIWNNQFDSARAAVDRMRDASGKYGLAGDEDIDTALVRFERKILAQKCRNTGDTLNLLMVRADRNVFLHNYPQAVRYFEDALKMIRDNAMCDFDLQAVSDTLRKYTPPARYQQKISDANMAVAVGDYSTALSVISGVVIPQDFNLKQFSLQPITLFDFVSGKNNIYLTEKSLSAVFETGNAGETMRFLHLFNSQGGQSGNVRKMQQELGRALAGTDHISNPAEDPESAIKSYEAGTGWYAAFSASYRDERKRLSK